MSAWLLLDRVFIAPDRLPLSSWPTTSPLFRSSTRLKPAAIPVIDGCGVIIFLRAMVLRGLEVRRRLATVRRLVPGRARDRLAALKARQPFLNPILAYFLGRPGRATRLRLDSGIKARELLTRVIRAPFTQNETVDFNTYVVFFSCYFHIAVNANHHSTPAQTGHRRLCWRQYWHTIISQRFLVINHQLQTVPAPIAAVMSGASPCPMLTVRGDQQEKRVPAHRSSHGPRVLLFESFFPVCQRE